MKSTYETVMKDCSDIPGRVAKIAGFPVHDFEAGGAAGSPLAAEDTTQ